MTASNGPSPSSVPNSEPVAAEPSMDDILASIRRIIADDDALPLSRSARAAAAPQAQRPQAPPAQAQPSSVASSRAASSADAFLGLGQRLFRGGDAASASDRPAMSSFRPPAPRAAPAHPYEAPKAPALKLRDFAPSEPPAHSASPDDSAKGPRASGPSVLAKGAESVKSAESVARISIPAPSRPAAPSQHAPVAAKAEPAHAPEPQALEAKAPEPKVVEPQAAEPKALETKALETKGSPVTPEAPKAASTQSAAVVPLTSIVSSLAEARLKAAPSPAKAAVKAEIPTAAPETAPVAEIAPEPAPVEAAPAPVAVEAADAPPPRPEPRRIPAPQPVVQLSPQAVETPDQPLLSPSTGARIGASFEALAESLMMRDPEMIERVAREMLRPMLKSWLDDNLPIVVERLVRAEIERIARGRG